MKPIRMKWTLEALKADALKYKTRGEWQKNSSAYKAAHRRNLVDECCSHMKSGLVMKWTTEALKADALKYKTRGEWYKNSSAYGAARKRNLLDECCSHMKTKRSTQ